MRTSLGSCNPDFIQALEIVFDKAEATSRQRSSSCGQARRISGEDGVSPASDRIEQTSTIDWAMRKADRFASEKPASNKGYLSGRSAPDDMRPSGQNLGPAQRQSPLRPGPGDPAEWSSPGKESGGKAKEVPLGRRRIAPRGGQHENRPTQIEERPAEFSTSHRAALKTSGCLSVRKTVWGMGLLPQGCLEGGDLFLQFARIFGLLGLGMLTDGSHRLAHLFDGLAAKQSGHAGAGGHQILGNP